MAYDATRGVSVLFGGRNATAYLSDTWEWDGVDWREVATSVAPPGRWQSRMTFDTTRNRVVLFGGMGDLPFGDTWEVDGTRRYTRCGFRRAAGCNNQRLRDW